MACMLMSQPTAGVYIDIDTILFWLGMEFGNSRQMRVRWVLGSANMQSLAR